jgi:ribulose 1,5-bisphosphate synthetase/thiazole synthase
MNNRSEINSKIDSETVIFGAGPAGLTAGFELAKNSQNVLILEFDLDYAGGKWDRPRFAALFQENYQAKPG